LKPDTVGYLKRVASRVFEADSDHGEISAWGESKSESFQSVVEATYPGSIDAWVSVGQADCAVLLCACDPLGWVVTQIVVVACGQRIGKRWGGLWRGVLNLHFDAPVEAHGVTRVEDAVEAGTLEVADIGRELPVVRLAAKERLGLRLDCRKSEQK
jgi:hypothetical protein